MTYTLEPMTIDHRQGVVEIFNYYIEHSFAAFFEKPIPEQWYDRILEATRHYPSCVARDENGQVVGFAFLKPHHPALRRTAEITYFLRPGHTRKGLGTLLLDRMVDGARTLGVDSILASISSPNEASLAFHRRHGFVECGRFVAVGHKHGQDFDVVWMQRRL